MKLFLALMLLSNMAFASSKLNFIWVIDNSGSMHAVQQKVIKNAESFFKQLDLMPGLEWRMGVLSTDEMDRPFLGFETSFSNKAENAYAKFSEALQNLGTNGSATEVPFKSLIDKLELYPEAVNEDEKVFFVFVSDEEDQSVESYGQVHFSMSAVVSKLTSISKNIKTITVLNASDLEGCSNDSWILKYAGSRYEALNKHFNGISLSACKNVYDFNSLLK